MWVCKLWSRRKKGDLLNSSRIINLNNLITNIDNFLECKKCAHKRYLQIQLEEKRDVENLTDYVDAYFQLTPSDEQKGIRELHEDFNKQTYNSQTTSHQDSFYMSISEHSNGLASTIEFKCNRKRQDKRLNNHHFTLRITQQNKHHSGNSRYAWILLLLFVTNVRYGHYTYMDWNTVSVRWRHIQ